LISNAGGLKENGEDFGQRQMGRRRGCRAATVRAAHSSQPGRGCCRFTLTPLINLNNGDGAWALWGVYQVDKRSRFLEVDGQVYEAYDPYLFVRDAYLQNRRYRMHDGDIPEDNSHLDDMEDMGDEDNN
jgi:phospholipid-binding lipoprotein MlaA